MHRHNIKPLLLAVISCCFVVPSASLATNKASPVEPRQFISIANGMTHSVEDRLPATFTSSWPTWVLDSTSTTAREDGKSDSLLLQIPDTTTSTGTDGYVTPTSIDEIWQPIDLKSPTMKLCLGLHIRDGVIRHLMPAVDLTLMSSADGDNNDHRNRGLCSVPRAHMWVDFRSLLLQDWKRYSLVAAAVNQKKTDSDQTGEETPTEEGEGDSIMIGGSQSIQRALQRAIDVLTQDPPKEWGQGSHILHVVLDEEDLDESSSTTTMYCPKPGNQLCVFLKGPKMSRPLASLEVQVTRTMAGSESEYLPDAYKTLFRDLSLRNERWAAYKERQAAKEPFS